MKPLTRYSMFLVLLGVPAALAAQDPKAPATQPAARASAAFVKIRDLAREALRKGRAAIVWSEPKFEYDAKAKVVIRYRPGTVDAEYLGFGTSEMTSGAEAAKGRARTKDPMRVIVEAMLTNETMVACFRDTKGAPDVWKKPLKALEHSIRTAVSELCATKNAEQARAVAAKLEREVVERKNELSRALQRLEWKKPAPRDEILEPEEELIEEVIEYKVVLRPRATRLRVLPYYVHGAWKATGLPESRWPWQVVALIGARGRKQDKVDGQEWPGAAFGEPRFAYRVDWPEGKQLAGELVLGREPIVLTPASK